MNEWVIVPDLPVSFAGEEDSQVVFSSRARFVASQFLLTSRSAPAGKLAKTRDSERSRVVPPGKPLLKKSAEGHPVPVDDQMSSSVALTTKSSLVEFVAS